MTSDSQPYSSCSGLRLTKPCSCYSAVAPSRYVWGTTEMPRPLWGGGQLKTPLLDLVCHNPNVRSSCKNSCGCRMLLQCLVTACLAHGGHDAYQTLPCALVLRLVLAHSCHGGWSRDAPGQVREEERVEAGSVVPSQLPACCGKCGLNQAQSVS